MPPLNVCNCSTYVTLGYWAVGLAVALALIDTGPGYARDHPPPSSRWLARAILPLGAAGILLPLVASAVVPDLWPPPDWMWLSALAQVPFLAFAVGWRRTWIRGRPAARRWWGAGTLQAGVLGAAIVLTAFRLLVTPPWRVAVILALFAGTGALLGGVTTMALQAREVWLLSRAPDLAREEPAAGCAAPPLSIVQMVYTGLALTLLSMSDVVWSMMLTGGEGSAQVGKGVLTWLCLSLVVPAVLLTVGLRRWRTPSGPLWTAMVASVATGQWTAGTVVFGFPGLVPPLP